MKILYYQTTSGGQPVDKYIRSLPKTERELMDAILLLLIEQGLKAELVSLRQIEGKLWEIRVTQHRIFYVMIDGNTMVLLHAYKKQSQKAPTKEINLAKRRMKEVLEYRGKKR